MTVRHYSDLIAWQKAVDLVVNVYRVTETFPQRETFGLANQIRRAAVSIPSNIAEGQGRGSTQEFLRFLCIARGSIQEVETQLIIACHLCYIDTETKNRLLQSTSETTRIINGLINSLKPLTTNH